MATQVVASLVHGGVSGADDRAAAGLLPGARRARPLRGPHGHPEPRSRSRGTPGRCAATAIF